MPNSGEVAYAGFSIVVTIIGVLVGGFIIYHGWDTIMAIVGTVAGIWGILYSVFWLIGAGFTRLANFYDN